MSIIPEHESDPNHYSRLFRRWPNRPGLYTPAYNKLIRGLQDLVDAMLDDGTEVCESKPPVPITAGYTYFGQFIDHDLTHDKTSFDEQWKLVPEEIKNHQSPRLDLSHLYGGDEQSRADNLFDGDRFIVGRKVDSIIFPTSDPHSFDVGFEKGSLLVGDRRSLENVILRQMTAVFSRLHNLAVDQGKSFEKARQQTVWQFQRLIIEDYLPHVLDRAVYKAVFVNNDPMIEWRHFSVPFEFAVAAFRFGHSMVLDSYFLSDKFPDRALLDLLSKDLHQGPLIKDWEIDWGKFFQNASPSGTSPITANPIDTRIVSGLFKVPIFTFRLFNPGPSRQFIHDNDTITLPVASLVRGAGLALASGQYVASRFGEPLLTQDELTTDCNGVLTPQGDVLKTYDLTEETPLFYYILKESEVRNNGDRLGPTGSRIVAETIYAALKSDQTSYINDPDGANYPVWKFPTGEGTILSLIELFMRATEF